MKTDPKNQKRVQGSRLHPEQASQNNNPKPAPEASFTPAPWRIEQTDRCTRWIVADRNGQTGCVCDISYDEENEPELAELDANARLIAAAPELFDAVNLAVEVMESVLADEMSLLDDMTEQQFAALARVLKRVLAKAREEAANE
jgi:hypothetical protein